MIQTGGMPRTNPAFDRIATGMVKKSASSVLSEPYWHQGERINNPIPGEVKIFSLISSGEYQDRETWHRSQRYV
jgi:hypothetical protein